ncbi:Chitinase 1, partial [Entomortierella chlamydospora]
MGQLSKINIKVYLGVPTSETTANAGYVAPERLREIVDTIRCVYSSFGGVTMWDMSQSYENIDEVATVPPGIIVVFEPAPIPSPDSLASTPPYSSLSLPPQPSTLPTSSPPLSESSPLSPSPLPPPAEVPPSQIAPKSPPPHAESCWDFQSCAPGTYCTSHGCDFINALVRDCHEIEQASITGPAGRKNNLSNQNHSIPEVLSNKTADGATNINDEYEPFFIDFTQLDASREVVGTTVPRMMRTTPRFLGLTCGFEQIETPFRLFWWVSFYVNPGQVVRLTSRGIIHQRGLEVFVANDPNQEAEHSFGGS